jgi:hypothetical protein
VVGRKVLISSAVAGLMAVVPAEGLAGAKPRLQPGGLECQDLVADLHWQRGEILASLPSLHDLRLFGITSTALKAIAKFNEQRGKIQEAGCTEGLPAPIGRPPQIIKIGQGQLSSFSVSALS